MESTDPNGFLDIKDELPQLPEQKKAIIEAIVKIQVAWMEDFATRFPKAAGNARSIHTEEDSAFNTSYETYLRGEISTYSEDTFVSYVKFISGLLKEGRNLAYETMENTAKLYGFDSLLEAEQKQA